MIIITKKWDKFIIFCFSVMESHLTKLRYEKRKENYKVSSAKYKFVIIRVYVG